MISFPDLLVLSASFLLLCGILILVVGLIIKDPTPIYKAVIILGCVASVLVALARLLRGY